MMTMRALRFCAIGCLLAGAVGAQARAETRLVAGEQLVLSNTLSEDVTIGTDRALSGHIRISLDGALSCLSVVEGQTAVIGTSRCSEDDGHLRIEVSPDAAVTITSTADGNIHVGDLHAPLVVSLSGSGDMTAGRAGGLVLSVRGSNDVSTGEIDGPVSLDMTGSGDVRIKEIRGALTSKQTGSGDLVIGGIDSESVNLEGAGSGDALLGRGRIGMLRAQFHGSSDLAVAATARTADVDASGGSDIKLGQVTGTLNKNASGGSDIIVGGPTLVDTLIGQVASKLGDAQPGAATVTVSDRSTVHFHMLTAAFVVLVLFISYRIVRRAGGLGGVRRQFGAKAPEGPTNPGVLALCDTMTKLDQRLSRLESYVTTREFDLNRKFRELGR